jgi:hypothetical protein
MARCSTEYCKTSCGAAAAAAGSINHEHVPKTPDRRDLPRCTDEKPKQSDVTGVCSLEAMSSCSESRAADEATPTARTPKRHSTPAYVEVSLVESVDGLLSAAGHGHESKAPGPAALAILHTCNRHADVNIKNAADHQSCISGRAGLPCRSCRDT